MKSKRIEWLDFAKGLTIFFVVLGHSIYFTSIYYLPLFIKFISVFIMPVFFAISGYLYKPIRSIKDYYELFYKKIAGFLIPYYLFSVLTYYLYKCRFHFETTQSGSPHFHSISDVFFVSHLSYLWFLYILFLVFIFVGSINLIYFSHKLFTRVFMITIILIIVFAAHIYVDGESKFIFMLLCFCSGYLLKRLNIFNENNLLKIKRAVIPTTLIWVILLLIFLDKVADNSSIYKIIIHVFDLSSVFVMFMICMSFNHNNNKIFDYFCKYGKDTLAIYLIHLPIILVFIKIPLLREIFKYNTSISIFLTIITWLLCVLSCKLLKHCKPLDFLLYPRVYLDKAFKKTKLGGKILK